jgi:hypothetical protein
MDCQKLISDSCSEEGDGGILGLDSVTPNDNNAVKAAKTQVIPV